MPEAKAQITISAKDRASSTIRRLKSSVGESSAAFKQLGIVAAASLAAIGAVVAKAISASNKQETALLKLDRSLQMAGTSYAKAGAQIDAFAKAQQASTRFGDDETQGVLTQLIQLTGSYSDATIRATRVVQDMAESGMSLSGATRAVGQAMAGNVQSLGRYVPSLRGIAQATLDAMSAEERQTMVLEALEKQYGGMAQAISPVAQKVANLGNTFGDLTEAFGDALKGSGLVEDTADIVIGAMADMEAYIKAHAPEISRAFVASLVPVVEFGKVMVMATKPVIQALQAYGAVVSATETAIHVVATAFSDYEGDAMNAARRSAKDTTVAFKEWESSARVTGELLDGIVATLEKLAQAGGKASVSLPGGRKRGGRGGGRAAAAKGKGGGEDPGMLFDPLDVGEDTREALALLDEVGSASEIAAIRYVDNLGIMQEATVQTSDVMADAFAEVGDAMEGYAMKAAGAAATALDAWVSGTSSYDNALKGMLASTLRSIGTEAATRAIFEGAMALASLAVYDYKGAAQHGAAAASFGTIAAAGIGLGGAATRAGWMDRSSGGATPASSTGSQSFSSGRAAGQQIVQHTTVVNQYIGGSLVRDREVGAYAAASIRRAEASGMTQTARNG